MRLIDADALMKEYDRVHAGPPGGARKLIEDAPTVDLPDALRAAGWREEGWVSVKDRLPDKHCGCLVFNKYGWSALDRWKGNGWMLSDDPEVTHWMPLPEPPKEDDNAEL